MEEKRILYLDYLRIFALLAVVILHVSALDWAKQPVSSMNWQVFNFYNSLVRFCVPVFVMISGACFLDKEREITIKKIFNRYILRIITAFVFWTILYAIISTLIEENNLIDGSKAKFFIASIIYGHYHMWFLYLIAGLYLITPLLRKITEDKALTEYFIVLSVLFASLTKISVFVPAIDEVVGKLLDKASINFVLGYTCYFVIGHYLHTYKISSKLKMVIYTLGCAGLLVTIFGNSLLSVKAGTPLETFYDYLMPNVLCVSCMIFMMFKEKVLCKNDDSKAVTNTKAINLAKLTFGAYLVHDIFLMIYKKIGLTMTIFTPVLLIPIVSVIVFGLSLLVAFVISKIPILNKYIM